MGYQVSGLDSKDGWTQLAGTAPGQRKDQEFFWSAGRPEFWGFSLRQSEEINNGKGSGRGCGKDYIVLSRLIVIYMQAKCNQPKFRLL
jgi:hypothetical protein